MKNPESIYHNVSHRDLPQDRGLFWHCESEALFQVTDPVELERCCNQIELVEVTGDQDWERRFLRQRP